MAFNSSPKETMSSRIKGGGLRRLKTYLFVIVCTVVYFVAILYDFEFFPSTLPNFASPNYSGFSGGFSKSTSHSSLADPYHFRVTSKAGLTITENGIKIPIIPYLQEMERLNMEILARHQKKITSVKRLGNQNFQPFETHAVPRQQG